jgi:WD40 repeat protein
LLACCHPDMSKVCGVFLGKMEETAFSDQVENPTGLSFSSDGRYLAIGSETGSVHIFDISTRQPTRVLEVMDTDLEGPALQVAGFKKDGQPCWLVTYQNQQVGLWNAAGALVGQTKLSFTAECLAVDVVREKFAVGGAEGQLEVYSAGLLQEIAGQVHAGKLIHLAFDRSSGQLFSAGSDNCVKEIDI